MNRVKRRKICPQPTAPLYEYVDAIPSAAEHQEQGLELKENVAYGPSKLSS